MNLSLSLNAAFLVTILFNYSGKALVGSVLIAEPGDDPQSLIHDKFAIVLVNND